MEIDNPQNQFKQYLKSEGFNVTQARQQIAEEIFETEDHFDVTTLWGRLRTETSISMSTIYRTLELLHDAGLVKEVDLGKPHKHYENIFDQSDHGHIICLDCGRVVEFPADQLNSAIERTARFNHFQIEYSKLQVFGYCDNCVPKVIDRKH